MNRAFKIITVLLVGLISGCGNNADNTSLPPGVLGYVNIDKNANDDHIPQVAFDGTNYLVVYGETLPGHDIIGALVSPGGAFLGYVEIDTSGNDDQAPSVDFDGTNYLVVYQRMNTTDHDIIGTFVSPSGVPSAPFAIDNSSNDDLAPSVAFDGTNYLVVYEETVSSTDHNIVGAQVSPAGAVLGGSPFAIDNSANDDLAPVAMFGGGNYLVVYQETVSSADHDIIGSRVSPAGAVLGGSPFAIDNSANDDLAPAVAFDGTNYLVAYQRTANPTNRDIIGAFVSTAGVPGAPYAIDNTSFDDLVPAIAFDGTNYLVVYQETIAGTNHDIIGTRVSPGGVVNPNVVLIDTSGFDDLVPAVAFGTANYLVAYEEVFSSTDHDIIGALITP